DRGTQKEVGKIVARNLSGEEVIAVFVACQERDLILVAVAAEFEAASNRVTSPDPGQGIAELEHVIVDVARMSGGAGPAREARYLDLRNSAQTIYRLGR